MTRAKSELFERTLVRPAAIAKALSHPVRIKILKILAESDVCICGEIVDRLPLSQSTVSQHLKELQEAGLIKGTVEGPRMCYCLNRKAVEKALHEFGGLLSSICCRKKQGGNKS